jgi:CheY-like chemotaxis protein
MRPDNLNATSHPSRPVFLVDDDESDRAIFARLLREAEIPNRLRAFATGEEIIDALIQVLRGASAPIACFVDVRMPGMNGFDVLRWIRCQHTLDDIAVIMLSSSEETQNLAEARHFGAQCYAAKFPTAEQLRAIIHEADRVATAIDESTFHLPCNLLLGQTQTVC